jgi:hypothetical protein
MRPTRTPFRFVPPLLATCLLALAACESTPPAAAPPAAGAASPAAGAAPTSRIAQEVNAKAQVVAIDAQRRIVTLRGEDGGLRQVRAGEAARNFDQIAVGDTLQVHYRIGVLATLLPAGETMRAPQGAAVAARAAKGEAPAAGAGVAVSIRVKIESIDPSRDIVVFSTVSGELIAHRIGTDQGREFVRKLKIGDIVQLDYDEALGIAIEKVAG